MDDGRLILETLDGDVAAYEELVRRYQELAFRTAYLVTGSEADAQDATQEAFVKAFRRLPQLRDPSSFRAWLLQIVGNEARNRRRGEARWLAVTLRAAVPVPEDPEEIALDAEEYREVLRTMKRLSEEERLVIGCRYLLELTEEEAANALGWPKGTVKSRLSRALARLTGLLREESAGAGSLAEEGDRRV